MNILKKLKSLKFGYAFLIIPVILILILIFNSVVVIKSGYVGVKTRFGKVVTELQPGLNFVLPIIEGVHVLEVREVVVQNKYSVSSKDLQTISMTLNVQYSIGTNVTELYKKFGGEVKQRLIAPRIAESINAVSARYTIEEFITKRNDMAYELLGEIKEDVNPYGIIVSACSIVEHDFSDEFDRAIERKLVASQNALTAQNELERVKAEAEAKVEAARGEAEAAKQLQNAVTPLLIQKMAIEKWDGKLPTNMYGSEIPFIKTVK